MNKGLSTVLFSSNDTNISIISGSGSNTIYLNSINNTNLIVIYGLNNIFFMF